MKPQAEQVSIFFNMGKPLVLHLHEWPDLGHATEIKEKNPAPNPLPLCRKAAELTSVDPFQFFNPGFECHGRMRLTQDVSRVQDGQHLLQGRSLKTEHLEW